MERILVQHALKLYLLHLSVLTIQYSYLDENLNKCSKVFSGLLARVIQHENDHLDGKIITDYATPSDLLEYKSHLETMRLENS